MSAVPLRASEVQPQVDRVVTVLGATGSIGASTMDLLRRSRDRFRVEALTAHSNVAALAELAKEFNVRFAAVAEESRYDELKAALAGTGIAVGAGESAMIEAAQRPANWVMAAMSGAAGLKPAIAAAERGVTVALANKECLVCAGEVFMRTAEKSGACVLPVDSEHNALFQAMGAGRREDLTKVILTASGGPFRTWTREQIENATIEQALKHPNWSMGRKITIDSASMFNKGLEIIEAYHLFDLEPDQIEVLVHPQSIIHGLGRVLRLLGDRADGRARHAHADRPLPRLAGAHRRSGQEARPCGHRPTDLRGAGSGALPLAAPGAGGASRRRRHADRVQCGERGCGRCVPERQDRLRRHRAAGRGDHGSGLPDQLAAQDRGRCAFH